MASIVSAKSYSVTAKIVSRQLRPSPDAYVCSKDETLKSGCRAEDARLRTAERLVNLIAIFCILSWRIFWMTMINRAAPSASPMT
jgi:hypothetical protein